VVATPAHERAAGRRALAQQGKALPDGSFPVPNGAYWDRARQAVGRVKDPAKRAQVARLLRKTAPAVGRSGALGQSWAAPGGSSHASPGYGIYLASDTWTCPECGHSGSESDFKGDNDGDEDDGSSGHGTLRTPAPSTGAVRDGVPLTVRTGAAHALAGYGDSIDLDWASFDAGKGGASQSAHDTASATASRTAKATAAKDDEAKAASHIASAKQLAQQGNHMQAMQHLKQASSLTSNPATSAQVSKLSKGVKQMAVQSGNSSANSWNTLANDGTRRAVELATGSVRRPIHGPLDVLASRGENRTAILRHRQGGATIAVLRKTDDDKWVATVNGKDLNPHDHQRSAISEAVGKWNGSLRPQAAPLQPSPVQTPLMAEYGIPAMRSAAFATSTAGASDGPRSTTSAASDDSGGGGGTDENGLTPKGQAIYKKLIAKGFPAARALAFAKNSQRAKAGSFGRSAA
jgi:hypothetical protein